MRILPIAVGLLEIVCCLPVYAQEVAPTTAPAPTGIAAEPTFPDASAAPVAAEGTAPAPAPAPAPAATPAPAPGWTLYQVDPQAAPVLVYPQYDPVELRRIERKMKRHERDVIRLERVMAIEGNEFSEEKYDRYRNQTAAGIALVAIGGVSLISTVIYFFHVLADDAREWSDRDYDSESGQYDGYSSKEEQEDAEHLGEPRQRVALWTMFIAGIAGVGIGVPLLVVGKHGKGRQEMLRRKDEILAPFDPGTASLSLFAAPEGGGGLRLSVRF